MSSITEIKHRIQSVRDTKKITNAMHLIASTKVRKAKSELDKTRPYFSALQKEIERIFSTEEDIDSRYFYPHSAPPSPAETFGVLVVTADKGLAGAYNINVIKEAKKLCDEHPNTKLFVVGEFGRQYFSHRGVPVEKSFLYTAQNPTLRRAREIANLLVEPAGSSTRFSSSTPISKAAGKRKSGARSFCRSIAATSPAATRCPRTSNTSLPPPRCSTMSCSAL